MPRPVYEDRRRIAAINSISAFREALHQRVLAAKQKMRLQTLILDGTWKFEGTAARPILHQGQPVRQFFPHVPRLLLGNRFQEFIDSQKVGEFQTYLSRSFLPPERVACTVCGEKWMFANYHDVHDDNETSVCSSYEFTGYSIRHVLRHFARRTDALYSIDMKADYIVRNDAHIDLTPVPQRREGRCDLTPLGVELAKTGQEANNSRGFKGAKDGITLEYVLRQGDELGLKKRNFYHSLCYRRMRMELERDRYRDAFAKAGFQGCRFIPIINECDGSRVPNPWFRVAVPSFGFVTVGFRHHVYEINWSDTSYRGDVTGGDKTDHGETYVHADNMEKMAKYLTCLREGLAAVGTS